MFTNIFFPWWWACKCYHYPNTWRGFFFQFDKILDSKINNDWDTGRSRGFELVTFKCEHSMRDAIRGMNTVLFLSSLLSFALPSIDLISLIFYFLSGFSLSCSLCMFSSVCLSFNWKQNLDSRNIVVNESGGNCWSTQPTSNGKVPNFFSHVFNISSQIAVAFAFAPTRMPRYLTGKEPMLQPNFPVPSCRLGISFMG